MRKRPLFFAGLSCFLSALLCSVCEAPLGLLLTAIAAAGLFALSFMRRLHLPRRETAAVCLSALLMAASFTAKTMLIVQPLLTLDGTTAKATVRVEETVGSNDAYIVRVESGELPKGLRLCLWTGYRQIAPEKGDTLTAAFELIAAYDQSRENGNTAKASGVYLYAWPSGDSDLLWEDGADTLPFFKKALYALQDAIHDTLYRRMPFDTAALSEGMLLGSRGNLSQEVSSDFRVSGVYHLLAVSGMHLTLLTGAVLWLMRALRCERHLCALTAMAANVLFTALCGFAASIVRACAMTLLMLGGQLFRRRADGLSSVGFAATFMLLCVPFCIFDLGWQLSFAATVGLLMGTPVWEREITARVRRALPHTAAIAAPVSAAVGVTLCASLATMPLTTLYFGELSTVFLIGNLLCVPLSSLLLVLNFLSVLTAPIGALSDILFWASDCLCRLLTGCAAWLADLPFASVSYAPFITVWLFLLVGALALGYYRRRLRGLCQALAAMTAVLIVTATAYTAMHRGVSHLAAASSDQPVITVRTDDTCGLIVTADGDTLKDAAALLRREGIDTLDWALWLAEPSHLSVELSALTVPIERLLVLAPPSEFVSLPQAREITVLEEGGVLTFGKNDRLTLQDDGVFLSIGEVDCFLALSDADIPTAASDCELLLLSGEAVPNADAFTAETVTVFCGHGDVETWRKQFPNARFAITHDTTTFLIREQGDISLRER